MALKLIIGNKNYSSWSLRPWIAMRHAGIAFEEELIPLYEPGSRERQLKYSPTGTVPCLIDGDVTVWESLAILDYLADKFPDKTLWPADLKARAFARSISSEMHAGFEALRQHCSMNMRRDRNKPRELTPEVKAERDADRCDLEREPRALRRRGAVPVRRILECRRDVCAGGVALCELLQFR